MDSSVRSGSVRAAPPVRIEVLPDAFWRWGCVLLGAAVAANVTVWLAAQWELSALAAFGLSFSTSLAAGFGMLLQGGLRLRGHLHWDSACWHWQAADRSGLPLRGDAQPVVDLGVWLLLRFVPEMKTSRALWLPLSRRALGGAWLPVRTALHGRPTRLRATPAPGSSAAGKTP